MVRNNSNRFLDVTISTSTSTSSSNGHVSPPHQQHSCPSLTEHSSKIFSSISHLALSPPVQQPLLRDESTRVQLQRQRLKEQHANALVSSSIPGFKTSAAFFASLRTNLRLSTSPPPSPMSTPPSMRGSTSSLPPPSPLAAADDSTEAAEDPLAGVPELFSYKAETDADMISALKLTADGVAQMRQQANSILLWNPTNLAVLIAALSLAAKLLMDYGRDIIAVGMSMLGGIMIYFAGARMCTERYIAAAEEVTWAWLGDADVFVTKFGDEIIGAIIVDWVTGEGRQKRKKSLRGEIKGWAVKRKYRGKGVGHALLEDAVRESKSKGAESVEFAEDFAGSLQVLPNYYNKTFANRVTRSQVVLQEVFDNNSGRSKRR